MTRGATTWPWKRLHSAPRGSRLPPGPRLHGHVRFYGRATTTVDRHHPPGTRLGVTFFDTSDMYGPHTNEVLVGKALRDRDEPSSPPNSASSATRTTRPSAPSTAGPSTCARPARSLSGWGSTTSTSTTSTASTPTRRLRRRWRHGRAGDRARSATSVSPRRRRRPSAGPTPCVRYRRCRPSTRSVRATRSRDPAHAAQLVSVRPLQPARSRLPYRRAALARRLDESDFRRYQPRFQGDNLADNIDIVEASTSSPRPRAARPGRSRWPSSTRRAATWRRSRVRSAAATSKRTSPRSTSSSAKRTWLSSTPWPPPGRSLLRHVPVTGRGRRR